MTGKRKRPPIGAKNDPHANRASTARAMGGIGAEVNSGRGTDAVGTGSAAMGRVKAESEEARVETCFECGSTSGRHLRGCSRRAPE